MDSCKHRGSFRPDNGGFFLPALKQLCATPSILRHSVSLGEGVQDLFFHHTIRGTQVPTAPNIKGPSQSTWCSRLPCLWATSKAYLEDFSKNSHFFWSWHLFRSKQTDTTRLCSFTIQNQTVTLHSPMRTISTGSPICLLAALPFVRFTFPFWKTLTQSTLHTSDLSSPFFFDSLPKPSPYCC